MIEEAGSGSGIHKYQRLSPETNGIMVRLVTGKHNKNVQIVFDRKSTKICKER